MRESTEDDLVAMVAVNDRHWRAVTGLHRALTVERLAAMRTIPGRDPGSDVPVVELDGEVVAWAALWAFAPYSQLFVALAVDPDLQDADHDESVRLLLAHGERRGRDHLAALGIAPDPARMIATEVVHDDVRTRDAVVRAGYAFGRHELEMVIDLARTPVAETPLPAGTAARVLGVDDGPVVGALLREAFVDHHGDVPFTDALVTDFLRDDARREACLIVDDADGPVAAMLARDRGDDGYVWAVGVLRRGRRQGIAPALLTRAFTAFAAAGRPLVALDVDASSLTGATRVYERVGMTARVVRDEYVRPLGAD